MRVAITGASGFIGSTLCHGLRALGYDVVPIVRARSGRGRLAAVEPFEVAVADIRDQSSLQRVFAGVEAVIHCAALVDPYAKPWEARSINFIATFNVCHAAVDSGVSQLIQMSTSAVYARDNPGGFPLSEDRGRIIKDPPVYDTYSINKAAAERVVLDFGNSGRLQTTCLRPGPVYGPGDRMSAPAASAIRARRMAIPGSRDIHLPLIHVDDLVSATASALKRPSSSARVYNLSGPARPTFAGYLEQLANGLGLEAKLPVVPVAAARAAAWALETWWSIRKREGPAPFNRFTVELIAANRVLDTQRAQSELQWRAQLSLEEGVKSVADWLQEQPPAPAAFPTLA